MKIEIGTKNTTLKTPKVSYTHPLVYLCVFVEMLGCPVFNIGL